MRLVTWNIRFAFGTDMRPSAGRVLDAMDAFAADVVCLQEAEARFGGRPSSLPLDDLAARGWMPVRGDTGPNLGYRGNAILLRGPWRFSGVRHMPLRGFETRGVLKARLSGPSGDVSLACVHLGLLALHRRVQIREIIAALSEMPAPRLIVGDTNEWRRWAELPVDEGWAVHAPGPTFPSRGPVFRLDRVIAGPGVTITDTQVLRSGFDRRASDHLPVAASATLGRGREAPA